MVVLPSTHLSNGEKEKLRRTERRWSEAINTDETKWEKRYDKDANNEVNENASLVYGHPMRGNPFKYEIQLLKYVCECIVCNQYNWDYAIFTESEWRSNQFTNRIVAWNEKKSERKPFSYNGMCQAFHVHRTTQIWHWTFRLYLYIR